MSGYASRSVADPRQSASSVVSVPATAAPSNAERQDELRGKKGTDAGLANYQASLGSWLGGELYQAVAPHLTLAALQGYAKDGLSSALKSGVGALGGLEGDVDKAAIKQFGEALAAQYGDLAAKWLDTPAGKDLAGGLASWIDAHPRLVVLVGLLAAGGAVLADMDVPKLKQEFELAEGLTAGLEAKLGSFRNLALEEVKAHLSYQSGPLTAAVKVEHDAEKGQSVSAEVGLKEKDAYSVSADVKFTGDGFEAAGVKGMLQTDAGKIEGGVSRKADADPVITGKLTRGDGTTSTADEVSYDAGSGVFRFKHSDLVGLGKHGKLETSFGAGSDGTNSLGVKGSGSLAPGLTGAAGFEHSTADKGGKLVDTQALTGSVAYKHGKRFDGAADARIASDGTGHFGANATWKPDDRWTLSANAKHGFGDKGATSFGGSANYADGKSKFAATGAFTTEKNKLDLSVMGQHRFTDDFALRGAAGFSSSDAGQRYSAGVHGAYFLDKDVALIAGGKYTRDEKGANHFVPEVGAQIKGVPLTIGIDTATKRWTVGASFSF
jgi:hypothetical protein